MKWRDVTRHDVVQAAKFVQSGENRVIAVHCRGGKGRTGTLVCAWLLFSQFCEGSEAALVHFATSRTELRKGSTTLQGVDTPSQKRCAKHPTLSLLSHLFVSLSVGPAL
jgi:hypothetical protein